MKMIKINSKWRLTSIVFFLLIGFGCAPTVITKHESPMTLKESADALTIKGKKYAGTEYYWQNPFEAFHLFKEAAQLGNAEAQAMTGRAYYFGYGTKKDLEKAAEWYTRAAEAGNPKGQSSLGYLFRMGLGVKQNDEAAYFWTQKAADQKNPVGMNNMGAFFQRGLIVKRDNATAVEWYTRSSQSGYPLAKANLGIMFQKGLGSKKNLGKAFKLYSEGCVKNHPDGHYGCFYLIRGTKKWSVEKKELVRAMDTIKTACDKGEASACQSLGDIYWEGWWKREDSEKAAAFYKRSCFLGSKSACRKLGAFYNFGIGVEKDESLAKIIFKNACEEGDTIACSVMKYGVKRPTQAKKKKRK
jgi:TPR repeat protein